MILKHVVNSEQREYFRDKVNASLFKAVTVLGNRFPDPEKYKIFHPNSKRLLEIQRKYLGFEGNERCREVILAVVRIVIAAIERSPNWRDRIFFFADELREGEWKERSYNHPKHNWNEPKPYGHGS